MYLVLCQTSNEGLTEPRPYGSGCLKSARNDLKRPLTVAPRLGRTRHFNRDKALGGLETVVSCEEGE